MAFAFVARRTTTVKPLQLVARIMFVCQEPSLPLRPHSISTRRVFMKKVLAAGVSSALSPSAFAMGPASPEKRPPARRAFKNLKPLAANAFYPLPLGTVMPKGWLQRQLQLQANGLSGHLDETWADVGPNSGWLGGTGESWERGPYFLDGLIPLAYLLNNAALKNKAQKFIDWTLNSQDASGMFGPRSNNDWWPRFVMLKALAQYEEATGDSRVVPFMHRYFLYQLSELPQRPLKDWGKFRWQDQLLTVIWLYNRIEDPRLLELARLLHRQGYDWVAEFANFPYKERITAEYIRLNQGGGMRDLGLATHGVNNGQAVKVGPVWSIVSGSKSDRDAASLMIAELNKYHGMPNGMFSCDEHLAGLNPSQGSELCTVVEYMFSLEQALAITGDPAFGDRLETLAFNALPGTMTDDMWAHQYDQQPNQVECSLHHKPWTTNGPESNLFGLEPNFGCCTANFHQGWPKFTASLFMLSEDDGLVIAAYAPSEVNTIVNGTPIRISQETDYPFRNKISLTVDPESACAFPLRLRIPAWAKGASIKVNDLAQTSPTAGSFACIDRTWRQGDRIEIVFPMKPRVSRWYRDSMAVERGPLVFSYSIGEDWLKLRDRGLTADWQVYPSSPWNYALSFDPSEPGKEIEVSEAEVGAVPFGRKGTPVTLRVKAKGIPEWMAEDGFAAAPPQSPVESAQVTEMIDLIPYAAAKLRITAFPLLKR